MGNAPSTSSLHPIQWQAAYGAFVWPFLLLFRLRGASRSLGACARFTAVGFIATFGLIALAIAWHQLGHPGLLSLAILGMCYWYWTIGFIALLRYRS